MDMVAKLTRISWWKDEDTVSTDLLVDLKHKFKVDIG